METIMFIPPCFRQILVLTSISLLTVTTVPAQAQVQDELEEITVVAQKQPYRGDLDIRELPQAIQVLSSDMLTDAGITRLDDALDLASGVARQNNFGGLWDSFAIRGFSGDINVPSGYLVNGFNGGRGFGGPRDASGIELIEVLKGPQGALFGRGEPGGTVNIVTKKPQFERFGNVRLSAGNYSTYRVEGDYTSPIVDTLAFRINGAYENADSFRDTLNSTKFTASPSFLWAISDGTTLLYEIEYTDQEVPFDRGVVAIEGELGVVPVSRFLGEPEDGPIDVNVFGQQLTFQHDFNDNWAFLAGGSYRTTSFEGYSSDPELVRSRQGFYFDHENLARQRRYRDFDSTHWVLRAEITGKFNTGSLVHHVLLGVDDEKFELDLLQDRFRPPSLATNPTFAQSNSINVFDPVYGSLPTPGPFVSTLEDQKATGFYAQDQIELTDRWRLLLGGRWDDFKQDITNRRNDSLSSRSFNEFTWQSGLVFDVNEVVSVYTSYGEGFAPNSGLDFAGDPFDPELSESFEVGAKVGTADGSFTGTIAYFNADKTNVLTADPVNSGFSLAIGEAKSSGIELDISGILAADVQFWLSYAYVDARVAEDVLDVNFGTPILAGEPLLNIPKNSGSLYVFRDFNVSDSVLRLGLGLTYVGKRLGETATDFYLPDYTLLKFLSSYELTDKWTFSFEVGNLFDKEHYLNSFATLWVAPGSPRTYTVSANYAFFD